MTGYSLHIGLNRVDPEHYNGWDGRLQSAETDARDMQAIADAQGFRSSSLRGSQATSARVLARLREAAAVARSGDTFLITYAGHGSQLPNLGDDDEDTGKDSTLVLYDRMLVDDELYAAWKTFSEGVRIYSFSDCCHAGTNTRAMPASFLNGSAVEARGPAGPSQSILVRAMPKDVWKPYVTSEANRKLYVQIKKSVIRSRGTAEPSVVLLAACQDTQVAGDLPTNGVFTDALKRVWSGGRFNGSYSELLAGAKDQMPRDQIPNFFPFGPLKDEMAKQRAFQLRNRGPRQHEENDAMNGNTEVTERTREALGDGGFGGDGPFGLRCTLDFTKYFDDEIRDRDGLGEFVATQVAPVIVEALLKAASARQKLQTTVPRGRGLEIMGRKCEFGIGIDHEGHVGGHMTCKF